MSGARSNVETDLSALERALIRAARAAHELYAAGDEEGARRIVHTECVPMLAACVQVDANFTVYEPTTGPVAPERADA